MKTKGITGLVSLMCTAISAGLLLGCQRGGSSAARTLPAVSSSSSTKDDAWEYKTVEKQESPDREQSIEQLQQQAQEFQQKGWLVLSVSGPLLQPDTTIHRRYELKRARM